ncbi:hypothetical protein AC482_01805 [miscellaneous Crenarchaeota group-15 archaeon DG-45]|uniref:Glycosidase n=1 Tax=miscellaneous Crenarchaeota group-15 archaeon DG-45 TaxID=1685127 RepID=A0A0M0BSD6_9ARCH|nr:MAG: hypothetical protein AC482_01805 [miscellaneous Crenarchaeota group-15 archaeon DG-45]
MVSVRAERLLNGPIITEATHPSIGANIQGPSLIRIPDWVEGHLGRYYIYFADHKGSYIRLAYADDLLGPWTVYPPGSLQLGQSHFPTEPPEAPPEQVDTFIARARSMGFNLDGLGHDPVKELTWSHIASPDVHVDHENARIVMYFHGLESFGNQVTRVATSRDGIHFEARPEVLGRSYWRAFSHEGYTYALAMPGQLYRSRESLTGFEAGPLLFNPDMRHAALLKKDDTLYVFWTQVGHVPERILLSTIDLSGDWENWQETEATEILRPETDWEGGDAPLEPSVRSVAYGHVNQLRDPAIYVEDDDVYLLYAVAGESGIAIAKLHFDDD